MLDRLPNDLIDLLGQWLSDDQDLGSLYQSCRSMRNGLTQQYAKRAFCPSCACFMMARSSPCHCCGARYCLGCSEWCTYFDDWVMRAHHPCQQWECECHECERSMFCPAQYCR